MESELPTPPSSKRSNDVYDPEAFQARVNYAAHCFRRGIRSRRSDTCFEMDDGDAVVTALVRRADASPGLKAAIAAQWSAANLRDGLPASWRDTAAKYAHIPYRNLPALARSLRLREGPIPS